MAEFKTFSLGEAVQQGQKMAANYAGMQDVVSGRQKASKASVLRQRMAEGDSSAFGELVGLDAGEAKKTFEAIKGADDAQKEQMKAQNESILKAGMYAMQGKTPQEQEQRYNESVSHLKNQGVDVTDYEGKFSPALVEELMWKASTMKQVIESQKSTGAKKGVDAQGKPVFFSQNSVSGEPTILKDVKPSNYQVYGKGGGGGRGGSSRKASDSNAMAKAVGTYLGATWKDDGKGNLSFSFKTDLDSKKSVELTAKAEAIFRDTNLSQRESVIRAAKEMGLVEKNDAPKQKGEKKSIKDFLDAQRNG